MKKKIALCLIAFFGISTNLFSQETFVNRMFEDDFGSPAFNPILNQFGIQWSRSIESAGGSIITVGHTFVSGQGENVYLIKRDVDGNIVWQTNVDVNSNSNNDYGINLYEAATGDIYVCGTTDNGGSTDYDGVIMRFSSAGFLIGSTTYAGSSNLNDIATALIIHPTTGNLVVAVTNENTTTGYDFMAVQFNPTSLASLGSQVTYDYTNLIDVVLGIEADPVSGDILLIGGSQSSLIESAYTIVAYDASLTYLSDTRTDLIGTPYDQPLAYKRDASNNLYITGKTLSGTTYDIRTIKVSSNYSIAWNVTLDVNGLDDIGTTIDIDPTNGNVIVGGLSTRSGNITDMICQRYNGSTGAAIGSPFIQQSEDNTGNATVKKLTTNPLGDVYFVAGEKGLSGLTQVVVGKISKKSFGSWQRKVVHPTVNILPSDIEVCSGGIFAISVVDSTTDEYLISGFEDLTLDTTRAYGSGGTKWAKNELFVMFDPSVVNKTLVDNEEREFGNLSDFLNVTANNIINAALEGNCEECTIKAVKVYGQKTTDTTAIDRQGDTIQHPTFWSTLLLQLPNSLPEKKAKNIFNNLKSIVLATQLDCYLELTSGPPNDSLYNTQANLHPTLTYPNADVNVEEAWGIDTSCGKPTIRGGLYDTGVMWKHREFGYTGTHSSGQNKMKGWLFGNYGIGNPANGGVDIRANSAFPDGFYDPLDHGTPVASIISGLRDNTSGIAGIAGGDAGNGNDGVTLYSLNVAAYKMYWLLNAYYEGHTGPAGRPNAKPYAYGVHFCNHSYKLEGWWPADSFPLVRAQVHWANRLKVTFVASRGNGTTNYYVIPTNFDSTWVISVGASNTSGTKWSGSSWGQGMDIIAPGETPIVPVAALDRTYRTFSGTSAAAPHASGAVALLMSYMNDSTKAYWNLAPEDCDFILQRSATDVGPPGYDTLNAYGRLNIGKALRMVEKPHRILYHFGTNFRFPYTITRSVHSNWDTVELTEAYESYELFKKTYAPGKYLVKTYRLDATVNHTGLYPSDSVMYFWPRHSGSHVYPLPINRKLDMHERVMITSLSPSSANLAGYIYEVRDVNNVHLGWWPRDTAKYNPLLQKSISYMEYSVLSKNKAVGIKEYNNQSSQIKLFPNPANLEQTLVVESSKGGDCVIELYDLTGRFVKKVYQGKVSPGKNQFVHDVGNLPNSMYIYVIRIDGTTHTKKFIKE